MKKEIERKFLVNDTSFLCDYKGVQIVQAYLASSEKMVVRVRTLADTGCLSLKGRNKGLTRLEYEYDIPLIDARNLIATVCSSRVILKTRYRVGVSAQQWDVDVFDGENKGLVVAEIELDHESEAFVMPNWVGADVTDDRRYYNAELSECPYSCWGAKP